MEKIDVSLIIDIVKDEETALRVCRRINEKIQQENQDRRNRQKSGIIQAKENGVKFGRPPVPVPSSFSAIYSSYKAGEISLGTAQRLCSMSRYAFYRAVKKYKAELEKQEDSGSEEV